MKKVLNILSLLIILFSVIGCDKNEGDIVETIVDLSIASNTIKYPVGEMWPDREAIYMIVRDNTFKTSFHLEVMNIEGFEYEEGCEYELKARRVFLKNPPADSLNPRYSLIEILLKKKVD